jgi:hypothetical protein
VFFGGNALFKGLDKSSDPSRYARQIAGTLPERFRFTILGYEETSPAFDYPHFSEGFASLAPRAMSVSRERPRHITAFPGGGSLVRAK